MSEVFEFVPGDDVPDETTPSVEFVPNEPKVKGGFVKGDPRLFHNLKKKRGWDNSRLGKKRPKPVRVEVEGDGVLRAMRHVLANEAQFDTIELERTARRWKDDSPKDFMLKFESMESAEKASRPGGSSDGPDLGHEAACKVLDRLLKECAK